MERDGLKRCPVPPLHVGPIGRTPITFRSRRLAWGELLRRAWRLEYHPLMKRSQIGCRQLKPRQLTTLSQRSSSTPLSVRTWAVLHSHRVPVNTRCSLADVRRTQNHSLRVTEPHQAAERRHPGSACEHG